jgi:thiamine pyrophosphokinase
MTRQEHSDAARTGTTRHALVVADGDVPPRALLDATWPGWIEGVTDVIAADGGYLRARSLGLRVDLLVGDLDSLPASTVEQAASAGIPIHRSSVDKDESDTELAVLEAIERGADRVTVLGAFGGPRFDHALANVWLLAHAALVGAEVILLDGTTRVSVVTAPDDDGRPVRRSLPGPVGSMVSLLPLGGDAEGVTTRGLRYPLAGEPLALGPARGISNVRTAPDASVTLDRGRMLVIETAQPDGGLSSTT